MARANGSISGAGWPAGRSRSSVGAAIVMSFLGGRPGLWRIENPGSRVVLAAIYRRCFVFLGDRHGCKPEYSPLADRIAAPQGSQGPDGQLRQWREFRLSGGISAGVEPQR